MAPSHDLPHAPQLASSRDVSTHTPRQSVCPAGHAHDPFMHVCPGTHAVSQRPQWATSDAVLTHPAPAQNDCPATAHAHAPLTQLCPAGQATPHALQFAGSRVRSTQPAPSQYVCPGGHTVRHDAMSPPSSPTVMHRVPAPHTTPHAPQFELSLDTSVQRFPHAIWRAGHAAHTRPPSVTDASSPAVGTHTSDARHPFERAPASSTVEQQR